MTPVHAAGPYLPSRTDGFDPRRVDILRSCDAERDVGLPRYTKHVRERMRERRINEAEVETTLRHPDRIVQDDANASVKFEKDYDDRTLKVWIAQDPQTSWTQANEAIIKSAAWRYTAVIPIEYDAAGRLIGKKGATIKAICSRSGASVRVQDGLVTISGGERYEDDRAKQLVAEALKTRRTNSNCRH